MEFKNKNKINKQINDNKFNFGIRRKRIDLAAILIDKKFAPSIIALLIFMYWMISYFISKNFFDTVIDNNNIFTKLISLILFVTFFLLVLYIGKKWFQEMNISNNRYIFSFGSMVLVLIVSFCIMYQANSEYGKFVKNSNFLDPLPDNLSLKKDIMPEAYRKVWTFGGYVFLSSLLILNKLPTEKNNK